MKPLTPHQIEVLRAAPISVDVDERNGDLHRGPRYRYHRVDGRIASGLWGRGLLQYRPTHPFGRSDGGLLIRTADGDDALSREIVR